MYQKLLSIGHVAPKPFTSPQPPYLNWYKSDLTCEYHTSVVGHNIHSCNAFKKWLMHLIKVEWVTFEEASNVIMNPLPNHTSCSGLMDALEVECLGNLRTPMVKEGCEEGIMNSTVVFCPYH